MGSLRLRRAAEKFRHVRVPRLRNAVASHYLQQRFCQDKDVEPEALVIHIPEVEIEFSPPIEGISAVHLRPSRDAWLHVMTPPLLRRIPLQIMHQQRAWPNQAHLPAQYVNQLRQFIKAGAAQ